MLLSWPYTILCEMIQASIRAVSPWRALPSLSFWSSWQGCCSGTSRRPATSHAPEALCCLHPGARSSASACPLSWEWPRWRPC